MKKTIFLIICVTIQLLRGNAQIAKGCFYDKSGAVEGNYNFWVYTPADYDNDNHKAPLIIFLHGASLCGKDINKVRKYGVLDAIGKGKIIPSLVLAPQNPGGAWNPIKINCLLEWMKKNYRVDTTRVYVIGMSLGGYGTLDFVGEYPQKVAAAMALCGGCSLSNFDGLGNVPLWIMHGTADKAVSIGQSKKVVEYLQNAGKDSLLRYSWLPQGSHGILARMFYLQKTYDWLFAHSTMDKPREVNKNFDIDISDIKQTYEELKWFRGMFDND